MGSDGSVTAVWSVHNAGGHLKRTRGCNGGTLTAEETNLHGCKYAVSPLSYTS